MPAPPIAGLGPREEVPRLNPAANPVAAGLSPQEGWVLSRVDGHTSFGELCLITGLDEPQTVEILKRLVASGLILTKNGSAPSAGASPAPTAPAAAPSSKSPPAVSSKRS